MNSEFKNALYGFAIGDAFGVPYEFSLRKDARDNLVEYMIPNNVYGTPSGTWSDDTQMILATCDSLISNNMKVNIESIRHNFEQWYYYGKYCIDGNMFDCGNTTSEAIRNRKGLYNKMSCGNGSLMRILPLAFIDGITNKDIIDVSSITHGHSLCTEACIIYVNIVRKLLNGEHITDAIINSISKESSFYICRNLAFNGKELDIKSSGYVVDTLTSVLWSILNTGSYEECILKAVSLGDDTDTIAALSGALASIFYGEESIPVEWMNDLRGKDIIDKYLF